MALTGSTNRADISVTAFILTLITPTIATAFKITIIIIPITTVGRSITTVLPGTFMERSLHTRAHPKNCKCPL